MRVDLLIQKAAKSKMTDEEFLRYVQSLASAGAPVQEDEETEDV